MLFPSMIFQAVFIWGSVFCFVFGKTNNVWKWKWKQQRNTTTHPLEWPKSRALPTNAGKDVEQRKPHTLLVGVQNGTAAVSVWWLLTNQCSRLWSGHAPWYLLKGAENLHPHKNLHVKIRTALYTTAKTWKEPRCPWAGEWVSKLWSILIRECYSAWNEMSYQVVKDMQGT